jgi:ligand-binding sensor domain-containing protein
MLSLNPMKICKFLFLIFIFGNQALLSQQKEFIFKNFTQEEGLPSNETYYVFEDSRHYLWIATDLGVVRYNGNKFEVFNLPDNVVFKIKEDSKGRIWFFTHTAQLAYFENEKIYPYKYNENIAKRIGRINIVDAYVDEQENISLSQSTDSNYYVSEGGNIKGSYIDMMNRTPQEFLITSFKNNVCFTQNSTGNHYLSSAFSITVKKKGKTLYYFIPEKHYPFHHYGSATSNGKDVYFFGGKTLARLKQDGSFKIIKMPSEILCLNSNNDDIWVGMMKGGAICLTGDLLKKSPGITLPNKSITSITYDYEGGLYFSTLENGIFYLKNNSIKVFSNKNIEANKSVSRLFNVNDSYLIYSNSYGLYSLVNNKSMKLLSLNNSDISDIFVDLQNNLYCFGGFVDLRSEMRKSNNKNFNFYYLLKNPSELLQLKNDIFITSNPGGVFKHKSSFFTYQNKYKSTFVSNLKQHAPYDSGYIEHVKVIGNKQVKLFKDNNDRVWGGSNNGLYRANNSYDTMLPFMASSQLLQKGISCIRQMENGMLVTGIRFGGVALIQDTSIVGNITEKDGLLSDKIRYLLPIKNDLWIATAKGISVVRFSSYNPLRYHITNIGKNDGFYNVTINQLIQFQGNIAAATSNGIYFIENPEEILTRKLPAIPFNINVINYYKGDTTGINEITLPYSNNRILLKYNAVCFNSPEEIKYAYHFEKKDTTWHITTSTELLLENLESGLYNLQIKAIIPGQNRSSDILKFTINVKKPWWQNNWFRLFTVLFLAAGIYIYVTHRIKKIRLKEKNKTDLNAKIAELEQTALRSQMNPHFIFNCLTSIQQLIVTGNKTDANEYLVKFARLIRKTLDLSTHSFITIREETEYLSEYIFLEQLRLSGQFEYHIIEKDINVDKIKIPNMMVQPVVENCIRHGIKSLEGKKGLINIQFEQTEHSIICTITDNGVGRDSSSMFNKNAFTSHKSYGIDIIEKRLKTFSEFNETEMGITINDLHNEDGSSAGTQVIMQLPFKMSI